MFTCSNSDFLHPLRYESGIKRERDEAFGVPAEPEEEEE